jgi:hypothetical protein
MTKSIIIVCSIFVVFAGMMACKDANFEKMKLEALKNNPVTEKTLDPNKVISFKDDVWPIMQASCGLSDNACHSSENADSGFQWVGYETVKQMQDDKGRYYKAINWENSDARLQMPQGKAKLDQVSLDLIKKWIDTGMPNN